jgi:N-dimethylarginine dimethylaminohydrolase
MCPPDYYGIEYEINPWMSVERQPDRALAREQWQALFEFLSGEAGLDVQLIDPVPGLPDMAFTANAGLVRDRTFVLGSFRNKERAGESLHYRAWFEKAAYAIRPVPPGISFEGEGDVLFAGQNDAFAGYFTRSDVRAHTRVADVFGVRLISLQLADPRFYHLDTCFCPLSEEAIVYYPGAFDSYAREVIEAHFADRIEVSEEEAKQFVCNALVVGDRYIQPRGGAQGLRPALERRGYRVHEFDMSEFIKAGGAVKCLVLILTRSVPPRKAFT